MLEVEERVNHLDELMAQLIQTVDRTSREMREFKQEMRTSHERFAQEMRASHERFAQEMRTSHERFAQEMRTSHERSEQETREFKQEMREFKDEMREFKDEMREFKDEMRKSKKESDKKWGELSRKLGTMAEDLVAPSIPRILQQVTGCTAELDYFAVRVRVKKPQTNEFDVIAVCEDYVIINETKSTLRSDHITNFYETMQKIREYFPQLAEKQFIGTIASLYVDDTLVNYGEKLGLIVLGFGEELMDVLNSPGFVAKRF